MFHKFAVVFQFEIIFAFFVRGVLSEENGVVLSEEGGVSGRG